MFIELFGMTRNINDLSASQTTTKKMFSDLFLESQLNTEKQVCFPKKKKKFFIIQTNRKVSVSTHDHHD